MPPVSLVTDTTQYLPREVIERHSIHLVSLYVNWNGRTDREADLPDYDAFYDYLRSGADLPSTSQPSVGDFLAVYEPLIERGDDILSIHLSGGISGTVHAAEQARQALLEQGVDEHRIAVIDSRSGCAGHGFMALAAANAPGGLAKKAAAAHALREDLQLLVAVDTLEFLRRGGRIGAARAWIGATLKVKPILTIEGEMQPVERVRTSARAFERLIEHLRQRKEDGCDAFGVQHTSAPEVAERLAERGREIYGADPVILSEIGPVIGTHTGPGLLGVAGLRSELLGTV
ncbi:DegV family protein [Candidatus Solirubrobacter pratensis]|uniref:DegV family protein n=1 Tax=Candidatus Solirubrobacter pratensis TaxID=1298857 RepID=UPI0003F8C96A|nr:DegV family protein [Candidatus Solirubrobacter pratensis]